MIFVYFNSLSLSFSRFATFDSFGVDTSRKWHAYRASASHTQYFYIKNARFPLTRVSNELRFFRFIKKANVVVYMHHRHA